MRKAWQRSSWKGFVLAVPRVSITSPAKAWITAVGSTWVSSVRWVQPRLPLTPLLDGGAEALEQVQAGQRLVGVAVIVTQWPG